MTQDIAHFINDTSELVGFGEPNHWEPAFGQIRNTLFAQLVDAGFRSIALETDRVAAMAVNDFVQQGIGTLDTVMSQGFTHGFGAIDANRKLVAWMRDYNQDVPSSQRLSLHGIDAPLEFTGDSPRRDLEYGRDYLGLDLDLSGLLGDDEQWSRTEAVVDPAQSPGGTAEAKQLRAIADDMLTWLYARAPELIAATSTTDWRRAKTHLTSALGLMRYHAQAANRIEESQRWSRLSATRDALMAQNLLDIRDIEAGRGPSLVFAHNAHLQRTPSHMSLVSYLTGAGIDICWNGAGSIIGSLLGQRYALVLGSLDNEERPDNPEQADRVASWNLTAENAAAFHGADAVVTVTSS